MADIVDAPTRSRMMSQIRGKDTKPELALRRSLWRNGLRGYRCHYRRAPGRPDVAFVRGRVAIFVDGAFWHGHPEFFVFGKSGDRWDEKIRRNIERDREVDVALCDLGWTSVRIWDFEILEDSDAVVRRITPVITQASA